MTHNEKVASYKAYLQTGDPQFIPAVYEKTAHVNEVQAWKSRWSKTASYHNKEARAGHPANVALARALSPGILPGLNPGGSKVHASHNGDFNHDIAGFIEGGVDPGTLSYLRGDKTAGPVTRPDGTFDTGFPGDDKAEWAKAKAQADAMEQSGVGYSPSPGKGKAPPVPLPAPSPPYRSQARPLPLPRTPKTPKTTFPPPRKKQKEKAAAGASVSLSDILRKAVGKIADPEIAKEGQHEKTAWGGWQAAMKAGFRLPETLRERAEQAEFAASPTTEEDLYRRYGRVPESSREKVRNRNNYWAQQPQEDYRRGVTDRITAENRAATTKNLKLPKTPLSARLRQLAEGAYTAARHVGNPAFSMGLRRGGSFSGWDKTPPSSHVSPGFEASLPALPGRSTGAIAKEGRQFKQAAGPLPLEYSRWNIGKAKRKIQPVGAPATTYDLHRRYGRLPKYGPLGRDSRPTKAVDWEPSEYAPQQGAQRLGGGLGYAARKIRDWFSRKDPNTTSAMGFRGRGHELQHARPMSPQYSPKAN